MSVEGNKEDVEKHEDKIDEPEKMHQENSPDKKIEKNEKIEESVNQLGFDPSSAKNTTNQQLMQGLKQHVLELEKLIDINKEVAETVPENDHPEAAPANIRTKFDGKLTVTIHKAAELSEKDASGKTKKRDPHVKIQLLQEPKDGKELQKWKTKGGKNISPTWEECFECQVNYDGGLRLELGVFDVNNDFLGKCTYAFDTTHKFEEPVELPLQPRAGKKRDLVVSGILKFSIQYVGSVAIPELKIDIISSTGESKTAKKGGGGFFGLGKKPIQKEPTLKVDKQQDKKEEKKR